MSHWKSLQYTITGRDRSRLAADSASSSFSGRLTAPGRCAHTCPARYVSRHLELSCAVTGYGNQGMTTDHGMCVVEPSSSRAGSYVGMTRGRDRNLAWVVGSTRLADAEEAFAWAIARPANALTAHAVPAQLGGEPPEPAVDDAARRMSQRLDQLQARSRPARSLSL